MTDELLRLARLFHKQLEAPSESEYTDLWYCLITHDVERCFISETTPAVQFLMSIVPLALHEK